MDSEKDKKRAIYCLTSKGAELGYRIKQLIGGDLFVYEKIKAEFSCLRFKRLTSLISEVFHAYREHIFITAMGIAVRGISPYIGSKEADPAVVVIDQNGRYCVSVLSGHLGGANELCKRIAELIKATPVITTATDTEGISSVELLAKKRGMHIENLSALKDVSFAMIEKEPVQLFDPDNVFPLDYPKIIKVSDETEWRKDIPGVWVSWKKTEALNNKLIVVPKSLIVGIGCNRGTKKEEIRDAVQSVFRSFGLNVKAIGLIATIDKKRDEKGILEFADEMDVAVKFFSSEELKCISVPNPSKTAEKHVRTKSVCEASAIAAVKMGQIVVPKQKFKNVTIAVALKKAH
ncbi:MAG: cobalamin biosynthesis protein CbiG [Deltaproteobacteria bacterium]|nr:MAG: cobalamin biosynthesis protein CbiG [Deltaproteobacteria bacterium]